MIKMNKTPVRIVRAHCHHCSCVVVLPRKRPAKGMCIMAFQQSSPLRFTDENGDVFGTWLVKRSFALVAPMCKLGLVVVSLVLAFFDPVYSAWDLWPRTFAHQYMVAWHATAWLFFALTLYFTRLPRSHSARQWFLTAFILLAQCLFAGFGVLSWLSMGDFSMVAVINLLIACVFVEAAGWRRSSYWLQTFCIIGALWVLDRSGRFVGELQFINPLAAAGVAYAVDGYMLRNAQDLFSQKCRVAAERQRADDVLYNALPPSIANELKANNRVLPQRHPQMTVLFADLVGFTHFASTVAPDDVVALLNDIFSRFDALVDQHGVEKIKTIGDAYMVVHLGDAATMAQFALDMQQCVNAFNAEHRQGFALRIGMHTGTTVSGVIGRKRFLYDVWGDAVNVASRMESHGEAGQIQVSETLCDVLKADFYFQARGAIEVKGKGPMAAYFLMGPRIKPCA